MSNKYINNVKVPVILNPDFASADPDPASDPASEPDLLFGYNYNIKTSKSVNHNELREHLLNVVPMAVNIYIAVTPHLDEGYNQV